MEKATDFLTKVVMMKTNYIYYGFEPERRFHGQLKANSENELNFSDVLTGKSTKFSPATTGINTKKSECNKVVNDSANVQRTLFDFDGMSARKIEKVDFTVFVSS